MSKGKENKNAEISARIAEILQYTGDTRNGFAVKLGYERAQTVYDVMNMKSAPSYDFFRRFSISEYSDIIDLKWLLSGKGPMLRTDDVPTLPDTTSIDTPMSSDTVLLRLMDKLDKKEAQIDHLQSELRVMTEELATLKAKYPESSTSHPEGLGHAKPASTKKPSSPPNADNATSATAQ
jgi:hypothetical protein